MKHSHKRIRGTTPEIEQAARHLRHRLTPAEVTLWQALRKRQLSGLRFRCQHPIDRFIVDFYCPACKLIIEIDGEIHQQQQDYDLARTEYLQAQGYRVIRFSNKAVETELAEVLATIEHHSSLLSKDLPPEWGAGGANAEFHELNQPKSISQKIESNEWLNFIK